MLVTSIALLMLFAAPAREDLDDPKIERLVSAIEPDDAGETSARRTYPAIQLGYSYGGAFGLTEPQWEHTFALYTWPWQSRWRLGLGIEVGVLSSDPGGHLGLSLSLGYQTHFPFHGYIDLMLMGGIYRVNLYQADVFSPISKIGLHSGFGLAIGRFHGVVGVLVEKIDLFLSSGTLSGVSAGVEFRMGF